MHTQRMGNVAVADTACVKIPFLIFLNKYLILYVFIIHLSFYSFVLCFNNRGLVAPQIFFCLSKRLWRCKQPYHLQVELLHFYNRMLLVVNNIFLIEHIAVQKFL